jgi:DtxR family Mn-dependent transcriptional regulator
MYGSASERAEDYLRAVYEITQQKGYARTNDISKELDVQQSTAVEMMKKLHNKGFVVYEKYGDVLLTPRGRDIAEAVKKRYHTFEKLLKLILVPENIASKDAHLLEHSLHPRTILQFERFVALVTHASANDRLEFDARWMDQFEKYCKKEKMRHAMVKR